MAATFNFDLVYDMAALLGKEARACNNVAGSKVFTHVREMATLMIAASATQLAYSEKWTSKIRVYRMASLKSRPRAVLQQPVLT